MRYQEAKEKPKTIHNIQFYHSDFCYFKVTYQFRMKMFLLIVYIPHRHLCTLDTSLLPKSLVLQSCRVQFVQPDDRTWQHKERVDFVLTFSNYQLCLTKLGKSQSHVYPTATEDSHLSLLTVLQTYDVDTLPSIAQIWQQFVNPGPGGYIFGQHCESTSVSCSSRRQNTIILCSGCEPIIKADGKSAAVEAHLLVQEQKKQKSSIPMPV